MCAEDCVFHCNLPLALPVLFSDHGSKLEKQLSEEIALKISSVVATIANFHHIKILFNKGKLINITKKIAGFL